MYTAITWIQLLLIMPKLGVDAKGNIGAAATSIYNIDVKDQTILKLENLNIGQLQKRGCGHDQSGEKNRQILPVEYCIILTQQMQSQHSLTMRHSPEHRFTACLNEQCFTTMMDNCHRRGNPEGYIQNYSSNKLPQKL